LINGDTMSFEYLADPSGKPAWHGRLPGKPEPYVLRDGEGEHAMLFTDLFTVLLSGDETGGRFGVIRSDCPAGDVIPTHSHNDTHETFYLIDGKLRLFFSDAEGKQITKLLLPGDFGYVPAGTPHAYQVEEAAKILGVMSGGFERFFQHMGQPTDHGTKEQPPFIPEFPRMQAAAERHNMRFMPEHTWSAAIDPEA
jgi:quercetin 2,3-dioxygenase